MSYLRDPESGEELWGIGVWEVASDLAQLSGRPLPGGLRWLGASPFGPPGPDGVWSGWPGATWSLPRLTLQRDPDATLRCALLWPALSGWEDWLPRALGQGEPAAAEPLSGFCADAQEFAGLIRTALSEIERGRFSKVVVARQQRSPVSRTLPQVLAQLVADPLAAVFALHQGGDWLVGASPERLARIGGGWLRADALAGSSARAPTPEEDSRLAVALLASPKDRAEHQLVVRFLAEQLAPLSDALQIPGEPVLRKLPGVQHLHTPVAAQLRPGVDPLGAAAALHPTPAVAGYPTRAARRFLEEREGIELGYYAGLVGWIGGQEGALYVALRCALIRSGQALLYAGCGVVAGSDPEAEWEETEIKLATMRSALGGG